MPTPGLPVQSSISRWDSQSLGMLDRQQSERGLHLPPHVPATAISPVTVVHLPQLSVTRRDHTCLRLSQVIANHHMQSISFASGGDTVRWAGWTSVPCVPAAFTDPTCWALCPSEELNPVDFFRLSPQDMTDYVAYVAKDPINQRGELSGSWPWAWSRAVLEGHRHTVMSSPQPATSWNAVRGSPRMSSAL